MGDEQRREPAAAVAAAAATEAAVDACPGNTDATRQTSPVLPRATSPPEPTRFTLSLWIPLKMRPSVKSGKAACVEPQALRGRVVDVEREGKPPLPTPPTTSDLSPPPPVFLAMDALSSIPAVDAADAAVVEAAAGTPEACVEDAEKKFARMGARLARRRSIPASRGLPLAVILAAAAAAALTAEEAESAAV